MVHKPEKVNIVFFIYNLHGDMLSIENMGYNDYLITIYINTMGNIKIGTQCVHVASLGCFNLASQGLYTSTSDLANEEKFLTSLNS